MRVSLRRDIKYPFLLCSNSKEKLRKKRYPVSRIPYPVSRIPCALKNTQWKVSLAHNIVRGILYSHIFFIRIFSPKCKVRDRYRLLCSNSKDKGVQKGFGPLTDFCGLHKNNQLLTFTNHYLLFFVVITTFCAFNCLQANKCR